MSERRRTIITYSLVVLTLQQSIGVANAADGPIIGLIRQEVGRLLSISSEGVHIAPLSAPLLLPAMTDSDPLLSQLRQFESVPVTSAGTFAPEGRTLLDALKTLDADIEIKAPALSPEQKHAVEDAKRLLYVDSFKFIRTDAYSNFLDYEQKYNDIMNRMSKASTTAEKSGIALEQRSLLRDWDVIGQRNQISAALRTIKSSSPEEVNKLRSSWELTLTPTGVGDYSTFWEQIAALNDWTAISISVSPMQLQGALLRAGDSATHIATEKSAAGLVEISLKVRLFRIPRRALDHPFLRSPNWQNKKSYVLSDGSPIDSAAELAPRYVAALVLVKGLELRFASPTDAWTDVARALRANSYVELGGLPLRNEAGPPPYTSPNYISVSGPYAISVVIRDVGKVPNPTPSDEWPIRW